MTLAELKRKLTAGAEYYLVFCNARPMEKELYRKVTQAQSNGVWYEGDGLKPFTQGFLEYPKASGFTETKDGWEFEKGGVVLGFRWTKGA